MKAGKTVTPPFMVPGWPHCLCYRITRVKENYVTKVHGGSLEKVFGDEEYHSWADVLHFPRLVVWWVLTVAIWLLPFGILSCIRDFYARRQEVANRSEV